ncbi:MAG: DUF5688 family protein [Turicibacter sp.]|nr:DUF5688 family protein [Turicibacter sp.]
MNTTLKITPKMSKIIKELVPAIMSIFNLGFIPTIDDVEEFSDEMYELAKKREPNLKKPLYTIFPKNTNTPSNVINTMHKHEIEFMQSGFDFFSEYVKNNNLTSATDEEILHHAAENLPRELTKGTKFQKPAINDEETKIKWMRFFEDLGAGNEFFSVEQKGEDGVIREEHFSFSEPLKDMGYDEFKAYAMESLAKIFGDKYDVVERKSPRGDDVVHEAIRVIEKDKRKSESGFIIAPFYRDYSMGKPIGEVILDMVKTTEDSEEIAKKMDLDDMDNFEKIKDKVIIRPINYDKNKKLLESHMYRRIGDIAIVIYMVVSKLKNGLSTTKIPKSVIEKWNMPENEIFSWASENTAKIFKPGLMQMEAVMKGITPPKYPAKNSLFLEPGFKLKKSQIGSYALFLGDTQNAATVPFLEGVSKKLAEILNDDFYVVMVETNFVVLHVKKNMPLRFVRQLVENDKRSPYSDEEAFLTYNVYEYSRNTDVLRMIEADEK